MHFSELLEKMPLVAVLRHIKPAEAMAVGQVLIDAGFLCLEVPMNSPNPCESIRLLADAFGGIALIGAGTVVTVEQVQQVADAGGKIIIMPHTDVEIIRKAKALGLTCVPGICTPSEAYTAINAGADAIKLFPAEGSPPQVLKAMRAILPNTLPVIPTGGITPDKMAEYVQAGAAGFGLGSALYKPGDTPDVVREKANYFVAAVNAMRGAVS